MYRDKLGLIKGVNRQLAFEDDPIYPFLDYDANQDDWFINWSPRPKQLEAILCQSFELGYGGAAGGGKSDLMIGLALTQHRRTLIMRREYPQLKAIIDRIKELLGNRVVYSGMDKVFTGLPASTVSYQPNGNSVLIPGASPRLIELGSCPHLGDEERYQGRPHDLLAYDELTHFNKSQFTFLQGWVRSTDPEVDRCRVLATFNPPTSSDGLWVKERYYPWITGEVQPGEILWYAMVDGEEHRVESGDPFDHNGNLIIPLSRSFIPARLDDNPDLARTNYRAVIMGLPEPLRSQLLHGDFTAEVGTDAYQLFPNDWLRLAVNRWKEYPKDYPEVSCQTGVGVDVARGGQASTVIAQSFGDYIAPLVKVKGHLTKTGDDVATLVMSYHRGNSHVWIDIGGVGASPYDALKPYLKHLVSPFNGADKSFKKDKSGLLRFYNRRAEAYWRVREMLDPTLGGKLALPDDKELLAGLQAIHWSLTPRGILIEDKEIINKRLGRSTDPEDAIVYALFPRPQKIIHGGSYVQ